MASFHFLGDRLLKEVEKTKGKSERVKAILDKVRKNRVIYKNSIENRKYLHCKMIKGPLDTGLLV